MASDNIVNGSTSGSSILDKLLPSCAETENENASNGGVDLTPIQDAQPEPEKNDLVVRRARHGHKRELEFALRSLTEIGTLILSGSRTRNKKVQLSDGGAEPSVQMGGQDPSYYGTQLSGSGCVQVALQVVDQMPHQIR